MRLWHGICYYRGEMKEYTDRKGYERESCASARPNGHVGSVLMEYLIVQVLVACLLMLVMNELFYNWGTAEFGPGGMGVKFFYQRLLGGLSLPVP